MRLWPPFFGQPKSPSAPMPTQQAPEHALPVTSGITLREQRHQYLDALKDFPSLAPRQASVAAFVTSLQRLGWCGEWDYADLLKEYDVVCKGSGATRMPAKWFWKGLEAQGCHRWRDERELEGNWGNRHRPYVVWIPRVAGGRVTDDVPERVVRLHRKKATGFVPRRSVRPQERRQMGATG